MVSHHAVEFGRRWFGAKVNSLWCDVSIACVRERFDKARGVEAVPMDLEPSAMDVLGIEPLLV
jgi:hypothetical protein